MRLRLGKGPVSCQFCRHENPAGARFCNDCGAHLAAPTITPEPRSYTPRHLVEKILASQSALRGERKLVTVLFADVVRSMELAERVDPEEWHRLLDRLFRILAGGVHRYEGTINQYTGDGIMALFGAPIAHEDHAQRACAAALDLARELGALAEEVRRESGLEFAVRMGLNSGEVVVGRIGDDLRMDYTAQGHVVGLAARVQQLAPPGGITVTEQTARLAAGFFDFLDRGEQSLKGASVPVRVFELRGPGQIRSRLESSRARGFSRFVGRERELALLEKALRETQSGRPKVVLVTAEPGAGKSRLCHEFVERARGVALHYARALSHGRMLPFHVMVALARSLFGVGEGASPSDVRDAVRRGLGNAQPDPIALDFWLDLLGVSDHVPAASGLDPEARRTRLFRSLLDLIQARARRELTLLWVEDLQSLDPTSEVALEMLTERLLAPESAGSGILIIATTRPEYRPLWSSGVEVLSLAPLGLQEFRTLFDDWLGSDDMLAPLCARIEARARGNPLFVEEMIRSLVEGGVLRGERGAYGLAAPIEEITLPETVQAVLASRIDRLADRDKHVLQAAAVVGRDVPIELLRTVVDLPAPELAASLAPLSTAELLGPAESPGEHAFRHPLAQEVAYRTQLLDRRRGTHAAIARALLIIHGPAAATHAALLAPHFDEAGEHLEAARWHEQAGRRVARSDPADGVRHCRRVTTLLASVPESRETLMLELTSRIALLEIGRIAGIEEREARGLFDEARAVAERLQDKAGHAFLLTSYGRLCGLAGEVGQYLACAERSTERTQSCARCCACGVICPARSPTAAVPSSSRKSAEACSLGWRPRRFSALRSSRTATSPRPRVCSSGRSRSLVIGAPHCGTCRASSRRSRTRSWPPVTAREPARSSLRRVSSSIGDEAGGLAPSMSRWRGFASWLRSPPPTAPRSRARSSPWTPSRPSWAPILIGASLRSSAHASPHNSVIDAESSRTQICPQRYRPTSARRHRGCRFRPPLNDKLVSAAIRPQREGFEVHLPGVSCRERHERDVQEGGGADQGASPVRRMR